MPNAASRPRFRLLRAAPPDARPGVVVDGWVDALAPGDVVLHARRGLQGERRSLRFRDPVATFTVDDPADTPALLERLDAQLRAGRAVAGYLGYEAGGVLVGTPAQRLAPYAQAWFGAFDRVEVVEPGAGGAPLRPPRRADGGLRELRWELDGDGWAARVAAVRAALVAGDSYQVNLTTGFGCRVDDVRDAYRALSGAQPVAFGALLDTGEVTVASLSPELFVRAQRTGDQLDLLTRPMKGTAARGADPATDEAIAADLRANPKARAENVMIVDLLRNDLGRIALPCSVRVQRLLDVERYRSVVQLTSSVAARAPATIGLAELMGALFPCGSITGAPKRRTMELIAELEDQPRGVYTGAIGFALPAAEASAGSIEQAVFSVAIRTLVVHTGVGERRGRGRLGVGGGIVVDSEAGAEHAELSAKARFFTHPAPPLGLFETLRWTAGHPARWARHVARLAASAAYYDVPFDGAAAAAAVAAAAEVARTAVTPAVGARPEVLRVRLDLHEDGRFSALATVHHEPDPAAPTPRVGWAVRPVSADHPRQRHKTTDRRRYDAASRWAAAAGLADVVFLNELGTVAEGAIGNLFVLDDDGRWRTPHVEDGALPGVLRSELLDAGAARTGTVTLHDLATRQVALGNALRGLRPVRFDPTARFDEAPGSAPSQEDQP